MRLIKYNTKLDSDFKNILVKEQACNYSKEKELNAPEKIYQMVTDVYDLPSMAEEYLYMIAFNTKFKPIGIFEISHGTVDASLINSREIFIRALLCGASSIVLIHNHPSGNVYPSKDDIKMTKLVIDAGRIIGIPVNDHIIVAKNKFFSFAEEKYI